MKKGKRGKKLQAAARPDPTLRMEQRSFAIRPASTKEHHAFIGEALILSERGHVDRGIWDIILKDVPPEERMQMMTEISLSAEAAHFHVSRFYIAEDPVTGQIAGGACIFPYPQVSVPTTFLTMYAALQDKRGLSKEAVDEVAASAAFYFDGFPDLDYDESYIIEAIYTAPAFRGRRVAQQIIDHLLTQVCPRDSFQYKKVFISCAAGNDSAYRAYQRTGFQPAGERSSQVCMETLGFHGFQVLRKDLPQ